MNLVMLIGRLTKDPEVRYTTGQNQMAVARFTVAVDRPPRGERQADFPSVVVFGRQAETCEKYLTKGSKVAIEGRIQTGKYQNKDGKTVYTTDVVASRVEFLETRKNDESGNQSVSELSPIAQQYATTPSQPKEKQMDISTVDFEQINEDVPF